jgi:pyrimidine-specific ribonucleoside hydrolase
METGDPDDVLTLLLLAAHPLVDLRAVTITPGTAEQVALVRWILQRLGLAETVKLGAQSWPRHQNDEGGNISKARFYQNFGRQYCVTDGTSNLPACQRADRVLVESCDEQTTLVTGAPLHNLHDVLRNFPEFRLGRWVAQGGFAGEGVVAREKQMDKFKGHQTFSTWNFGGNIPAAEAALASDLILKKICVSKNVCHGAVYEDDWHAALRRAADQADVDFKALQCTSARCVGLRMMYNAMDDFLRRSPGGKKLHDPLALAVALDESVCELAEVKLFCQKGKWGSRLCPGSGTWISTAHNAQQFQRVLLEGPCTEGRHVDSSTSGARQRRWKNRNRVTREVVDT